MKRDHVGFAIFLICLVLAPKIPLGFSALPGKSSMSLGIIGLVIWALLSYKHILKIKCLPNMGAAKGLLIFGVYAFGISLASSSLVAMAYAAQYLFYLLFSYLLFVGYLSRAAAAGQLSVALGILAWIGFVFSLGVIISVWTGPFYPHQTLWTARQWDGLLIQQGVGFAEGTNAAGAVLIVFNAFFWPAHRQNKSSWIICSLSLLALLVTISRSAILSFIIGLVSFLFIVAIRTALRGRVSRKKIYFSNIGILCLVLIGATIVAFSYSIENREVIPAIATGIGLGEGGVIRSDTETRLDLWEGGIRKWLDGAIYERLIGNGFRSSFSISDDSESGSWQTPHNFYLAILGDFGIVGLFLFLAPLLWFIFRISARLFRSGGTPVEQFSFVGMVGLMVHNMTETFFYSPTLISLLMFILILPSIRCLQHIGTPNRMGDPWNSH